jgi:coenzyme F420 hydrogenase subunit beta
LSDETVDRILDVCPSKRVDGLPQDLIGPDTQIDLVWGPYLRMVHGWATDPQERFEGSTGGVLTALGTYLVSSGRVDFVLHAKASRQHPTFGERHLSFNRADVIEGAGSRYGPTAPLIDIGEILNREKTFAFIGKPCDITALRNYARHDPRVNDLVKYWLTLVCGGFMPPDGTAHFLAKHGVKPKELATLRYRGRGCPGPTRFETLNGRVVEASYTEFWGENYDAWTLPHRCKVCPDSIGEGADIIAADAWPGGGPDPDVTDDPGTNVIIIRTKPGAELMDAAERNGSITLEREASPQDMNDYQPHQVARKYTVWARFQGLIAEGRDVPKTTGLRIEEELYVARDSSDFSPSARRMRIVKGASSSGKKRT